MGITTCILKNENYNMHFKKWELQCYRNQISYVDSQRNIAVVLDTEDLNKSIKSNAALDVCTTVHLLQSPNSERIDLRFDA